jgi:hypothetical protein
LTSDLVAFRLTQNGPMSSIRWQKMERSAAIDTNAACLERCRRPLDQRADSTHRDAGQLEVSVAGSMPTPVKHQHFGNRRNPNQRLV